MGTLQDLPGELNLVLYVGRAVTPTITFPTSLAGRTFTASVDTGTAVVTPTVTVSTNTLSFPLTAANLANESTSGVLLITETTSGAVPYIAGRVRVTRNAGTQNASATVAINPTTTVTVSVVSWPSPATFTTSTARDAAITLPTAGMSAYLTTPKQETVHDGTGWTIMSEPTQTYTPQIDQGATTNIAKTVTQARYKRADGWIQGALRITMSGAGTAGSAVTVTAPIAPNVSDGNIYIVGTGYYNNTTGTLQYATIVSLVNGKFQFIRADTNPSNYIGADPSTALASGHVLSFSFEYEMTTRYS